MEGKNKVKPIQNLGESVKKGLAYYPITFYLGLLLFALTGVFLFLHLKFHFIISLPSIYFWIQANSTTLLLIATMLLSVVLVASGLAYKQVSKLSREDYAIWLQQKSTRTLFPFFTPLHDWLRMRVTVYRWWHTRTYASPIHSIILVIFVIFMFRQVVTSNHQQLIVSPAGTGNYYWIDGFAQAWNTSQPTTALNDGSVGDQSTSAGSGYFQETLFYDNGSQATLTDYQFTTFSGSGTTRRIFAGSNDATNWTTITALGTVSDATATGVANTVSGLSSSFRYFRLGLWDMGSQYEFPTDFRLTFSAPAGASTLKVGLGDQFTTSVDSNKWNANNSASSTDTIVSNKLKALATTTANSFAGVNSNTKLMLRGDFDVQVDYDDTSMPTPAAGTCADTTFQVIGPTYAYEILNRKASDGTFVFTNWATQGNTGTGSATGASTGKMRIVRTGTSITTWYATATGAWTQIAGSYTSVDSGDMSVTLVANNNCGATGIAPLAYFDNFIISKGYNATKNSAFDTVVEALDSTGAAVYSSYTGIVHFTSSDGSATLPSNYTFVSGDNGIHTFATGVTLQTVASSKTVTATDTVTGTITGVGTFGVMGPATTYGITGTPANATAGTAFNVTLTAKDSAGNVATGYTGIAHFTSTDGAATLPGDYTFVSGDKGVHTFSINLKTAGSKTFTATDTVTGTITATSSAVTVANASYVVNPNTGSTASIALDAVSTAGSKAGVYGCPIDVVTATITIGSGSNRLLLLGANGALGAASTLASADLDGVALTKYNTQTIGASYQQDVWYLKNPATGSHTITAVYDDTNGCLTNPFYNITAMSFTGVDQTTTIEAGHMSQDTSGSATTATNAVTTVSANAWIADFLMNASTDTVTPTSPLTLQVTGATGITERGATKGPVVSPAATTQTWTLGTGSLYAMDDVVLKPASTTSTVTASTAGSAFNLTVTERDGTGATNTGYRGTVHFTSTDPLAVLPADYAYLAGDNGVHTFTNGATLKTFGPQTITATDTVTGTTVGTSTVVMVNGATAATMAVKYNNSDTFDTSIDSNKWVTTGFTTAPTIVSGRLKGLSTTATSASSGVKSNGKFVLHGDFDVQVDFDNSSQPTPTTNNELASIQVAGTTYSYSVSGVKNTDASYTYSNWNNQINNNWTISSFPTGTATGKLRLARTGSTMYSYLWISNAWYLNGIQTGADTTDMNVAVFASNNGATSQAPLAYFDNFIINSGQANTSVNAGTATTATVSAIDAYGNIAPGYTGIAHFTSTDGAATLPSNYTFVTLDAGVHAFITPVFNTAGTQTITATDTVTGTITGTSGNMTVNSVVGPISTFVLTSTPTTATAGTAFSTTVTAKDASNNTVTTYTGTVHFTSTDAYPAVLPGDYTFVGGDNGVHTFTNGITMKTAGSKTFTVTDTGNGAVTVTSAAITVSPATSNNMVMSSTPTTATAGTAFSSTVTVKDAYNNTVTGYTGTVHFTSNDTLAVLPADYTYVGGDNGAHTFTNAITLKTAASKTFTLTDTGNGALTVTSAAITVSPAAAASLVWGSIPGSATAGTAFTMSLTAKDAYNNTATGYTGTVAFTSTDAQKVVPSNYTFVGGDSGTHSFSSGFTLKTSGSQTITATDSGNSLSIATSSITVSANTAVVHMVTGITSPINAGTASNITVTAKDAYNNTDTVYTGTVHFTSTDGAAVLPSNYTFVGGDSGSHTFTNGVTFKTVGTQTVTATDTVTGTITGTSSSITVNPGPVSSLVLTSTPTTATAGTAFSSTVTAKDAYSNTVTGYTGTVAFTSTDGAAVLPSNYTFVGGDNGAHTFTNAITLKTAGSKTFTVADAGNSLTVTSSTITVSPASASTYAWSSVPGTATAGTAFTMTLTAKDAYSNTVTGYTGTTHFTSTDSQVVVPADYTFVGGDNGVHTFTTGFNLKSVGSKTITATDTGAGSINATTAGITVSAGAASQIVLSTSASTTAGTAFSLTATLKDAYGNTESGYTGTVHFTSNDGQAVLPANYTFVGGDAGSHIFNNALTLKTAGSKTVTVAETSPGSLTTTANVTVSPASASSLVLSSTPTTATAGTAFSTTATAEDAYGNAATGYTGTVHFTSNDGAATLPGDYTFIGGDSGVHTFTNAITLKTAGSKTFTLTDTGNGSLTVTSSSITVSPAAASSIGWSSVPATATAGINFNSVVTAHDAYNNVATSYTGTVHFSSTDGAAVLPSSYTFVGGDNGTHTFTGGFTLKTDGSQTITATDIGNGSLTATTSGITVSAGAATQLVITSTPSSTTAGTAFSTTVTLKDADGNVASGYTGTVHFTSTDGQAVLPADYTFTGGNAGTHTFTNGINLKTAGSKSFTVTDTVTGSINNSANVTVNNASINTLVLTGVPVTHTAGQTFSVTVSPHDAYGNIATGYTGTLHFTSNDAQAQLPSNYTVLAGNTGDLVFGNLIFKTAGTDTLTVTDTVTGSLTASGSSTVSAATVSSLIFSNIAGTQTAGTAFSPTLTAKDAYSNTVTSYAGTVHFTSGDGQAVLPSDYTFVGGDNGTHTFTNGFTLKTDGSQSLTATDTGNGSLTVTDNITVNAAAASQLVLSTIVSTQAGSPFTSTVTAKDSFNNTITNFGGAVYFSSSDSQSVLPSNYTFVGGDNGSHTFTNGFTLKTAGSQGLTVGGVGVNSSSATITVNPSYTTTLTMSLPNPVTAGVATSSTITAKDQYGNTTPAYVDTIHFTSSDGQAILPADYAFASGDNGVHAFTNAVTFKTGGTQSLTVTDNDDGTIFASANTTVNAGTPTQLSVTSTPASTTAGAVFSATVTAKDTGGNTVTGYTGTVHFTSNDTLATLPGDYTFISGDHGTHTFTNAITLKTAGSKNFTIAETSPGTLTTTTNITVNAAAASRLIMSTSPAASVVAGTAFSATVTARDAYNNTATGYTGSVRFLSNDTQATLPIDYAFASGDAGHHTFSNLYLKTTGSKSLTATDIASGSLSVTLNMTVTSSTATQLVYGSVPVSSAAADPISVTVLARDTYNNTATGYAGTVHFASTDSQATLPADYTFVPGDNGSHTFSGNLVLRSSGAQTLTITDTGNSGMTQTAQIVISSAPGAQMQMSTVVSTPAGSPFSAIITMKDAYGNLVTGYNGTVHLSSSDSQATLPADYTFVSGDNGSHTFSGIVFRTTGTKTLAANETSGSLSSSANIVVTPGAASQIGFSGLPNSSAAGSSFGGTLTVTDSVGNVVTNYTGTVRFTSSDGQATLPANYTFVPGDNGVHAFTGMILKKAGSITITATDTNGTPAGSATVNITAGAINGYNVTATSPQIAGAGWSETATALDIYGNGVNDSSTTITPTTSDSDLTFYINNSYTTVATSYNLTNGRATLYMMASKDGSATITVTDSNNKKGSSGTITINAAPVTPPTGTGTTTTTTQQTTSQTANSETGGKVAIFQSNPTVQKAADTTSIVSSAVAIASFAPAASAVTTAITTSMLQGVSIFNLPFIGLARRKSKKRWGTVKNTLTGLPIAGVFVELWSLEKPVLLGKTLTDNSGQFAFLVDRPGQFYLRVDNPLYEAYHSLPIIVTNPKEDIIKTEVALKPIESILQNRLRRAQKLIKATEFLYYLHWPLLIAGTFLAALTLYDKVTTGRIIMASIYGGMWLMKILESKYERPFGVVSDSATERPQPLSVVQLTKDTPEGGPEVVRSTITDSRGRFMFVVKPSKYNLTAAKKGFSPENKEVTGQKVNMDVKLKWDEQDKL